VPVDGVVASREAAVMMRHAWIVLGWCLAGCPADDNGGEESGVSASATLTQGTGETGTEPTSSTTTMSTSSGSSEDSSSGAPTSSGESTAAGSSSSGDVNLCDPVIPGEWNSCHDGTGNVDTTLCNWVGDPDATGFIGCLVSSDMPEFNACFISGCEDACDCFAPPATGTATVECGEILMDGGTGCHLTCEDGGTCPDGMECVGTSCFWPAAR
jgi:hypothetical protein